MKSPDWVYDDELSKIISAQLSSQQRPVFLDIGAHAGFISLNILNSAPGTRIHAFEPGPFQSELFRKTIKANNLGSQITLYDFALGSKPGVSKFYCQQAPDADWSMNNGLLNTGLGRGRLRTISVDVRTLDTWWQESGKPEIHAVKLDTEGAELLVLRGAVSLLRSTRPHVYLEINPLNLLPYPYDAFDLLAYFTEHSYRLHTFSGTLITSDNLTELLKDHENFIATPLKPDGR